MEWFHGTSVSFECFDSSFIGFGNDELGSGFYFTNDWSTAVGYAGRSDDETAVPTILTVDLAITSPLPPHGGVGAEQIRHIIKNAPDYVETLWNFGDVDYDGEEAVMRTAIATYKRIIDANTLDGLNSLSNDFFSGHEALFLRVVSEQTGYDGLIRRVGEQTHAVAWFPEQIRILSRTELNANNPGALLRT